MPNAIGSTKKANDETPIELQELVKAVNAPAHSFTVTRSCPPSNAWWNAALVDAAF